MKAIPTILFVFCSLFVHSQFICGTSTVTDIDGNVYNTVQIGARCWMKENMRAIHYANGQPVGMAEHPEREITPLICQPGRLQLSVLVSREETVTVNIYNIAGRGVYHTVLPCSSDNNVINCTLGPKGVYFVEVICGISKETFTAIGADHSLTSADLQSIAQEKVVKSDSIILTPTSRYAFDYNHDPALGLQYGKLYTPLAALNTTDYTGIIQGICPSGWHVPTDEDWMDLEISCGMSPSDAQGMFWRGSIGPSLMITGPEWYSGVGTDDFGFAAKGSGWYGRIINGIPAFVYLNYECNWWTYEPTHGLLIRLLNYSMPGVYRFVQDPKSAASIRCIKDQ